jgi:hypothetical protein
VFDRSDQINQNSRASSVPPRGAGQTGQWSISLQCRKIRSRRLRRHNATKLCLFALATECVFGVSVITRSTKEWWSQTGSNRRHPACKAGALPAELWPHFLDNQLQLKLVGPGGLEPPTSRLSGVRSNHLSYGPPDSVRSSLCSVGKAPDELGVSQHTRTSFNLVETRSDNVRRL